MANGFGNGSGRPPDPERMLLEALQRLRAHVPGNAAGIVGVLVAALLWIATGVYQVNPSEIGVVLRFGRVVTTTSPGLHWHLPWPIEVVLKPPVTRVLKAELGFRTLDPGPPARYRKVIEEARMLTADGNIVEVDFVVQYRIKDPVAYLFNVIDPLEALRDLAESAMREVVGSTTIDDALTEGRMAVQTASQELLQEALDTYAAGIAVTTVKLQDVVPPGPVQDAFKDVINAEQDRERMINEAQGFANDILPKARGSAAQLINEAEGYADAIVKEAEGEAQRFELVRREYAKAKEVTRKRLYLETLEEVLPRVDKFVIDGNAAGSTLPLLPLREPAAAVALPGTGGAKQ
jgi:membrane protease subunit HflK